MGQLILLDDAAAAGGLQIAAHGRGRLRGGEGADQGAVKGAFFAEIGAMDDRLPFAKLTGEFGLERFELGLGIGLGALRGDLDRIAACRRGRCCATGALGASVRATRERGGSAAGAAPCATGTMASGALPPALGAVILAGASVALGRAAVPGRRSRPGRRGRGIRVADLVRANGDGVNLLGLT